jgi:hypothetical protein
VFSRHTARDYKITVFSMFIFKIGGLGKRCEKKRGFAFGRSEKGILYLSGATDEYRTYQQKKYNAILLIPSEVMMMNKKRLLSSVKYRYCCVGIALFEALQCIYFYSLYGRFC